MIKRFKLFVGNNYGIQSADGEVIIDSIISVGDAEVLCDLLNDLLNENEQLKSTKKKRIVRLRNQRKELSKQQEAIWGYKGDIKQLRKENEQLKQRIKELEKVEKLAFNKGLIGYKKGDVE